MLSKACSRETWLLAGSSLKSLATAIFVIKTCMFHCNVSLAKMYHVKDCSVEPDMFVTLKLVLKLHLFALPLATATHSQTHEPFNNNIAFQVTYLLFSLIIYQVIVSNIRSNKDNIALVRDFHNWPSHDSNVRARGSFEVVYGYRRAGGLCLREKMKFKVLI